LGGHEFKANLSYIIRPCLKKEKEERKERKEGKRVKRERQRER
jgi:hypothetical protein